MEKTYSQYMKEYQKANYDEIKLHIPKGRKEVWKAKAEAENKSLQRYIIDIIEKKLEE